MPAPFVEPPLAPAAVIAGGCIACGCPLRLGRRYGAVVLGACGACGSRTALPRPSAESAASLHDSPDYFEKEYFDARRGRAEAAEKRFGAILSTLARTRPGLRLTGRRMLDIGCDTGELPAAAARVAGVEPFGVDVAARPLESARAAGIRCFQGDVRAAPSEFADFALVTMVDVLEHVPQPTEFLADARARLAPDGVVYLETPNWRSLVYGVGRLLARLPGANGSHALERLFPPEHIQYFTSDGLTKVARAAGLRPLIVFSRVLERDALAGSGGLRAALAALQTPDRLLGHEILLCALLVPSRAPA